MMKRISFIGLAMLALLAGCAREEDFVPGDEAAMAPVSLFLGVDAAEGVDVKSWDTFPVNESPEAKVAIQNVWILQFDATTNVLAADPLYVSPYSAGMQVKLNSELGHASLLVFVANTFNPHLSMGTAGATTLDEFKKKYIPVSDEKSLFALSGGQYYQRLNGACEVTIGDQNMSIGTAQAPIELKRNIARVNITVQNTTTASAEYRLRIIGVQLCSVPVKDYLYLHYLSPDALPSIFPQDIAQTLDYDADLFIDPVAGLQPVGDENDTSINPGQNTSVRYYVPANMRGTGSAAAPDKKSTQAPHGATFVRVYAYDDLNRSYSFIFYLGSNLTTDYNLEPNHSYEYIFVITNDWKDKVRNGDPRINHYETNWDLTGASVERSNCYILQVPPIPDPTYFKIPIEKANMFWNDAVYNYKLKPDGVNPIVVREYGNSVFTSADMVIGANDDWEVDILWSDFNPGDGNLYFVTDDDKVTHRTSYSGHGSADTGYFILQVKGGVQGNVVVGLKKKLQPKTGDTSGWSNLECYVWSWHLWFTDYEPDQLPATPPADAYFYKVSGGKVLRYGLSDAFMMDRPLGATYNPNNPAFLSKVGLTAGKEDATLGMFYQFGRKDPFPNYRPLYYHGSTTATLTYEEVTGSNAEAILKSDAYMAKVKRSNLKRTNHPLMYSPNEKLNVPFSINHPMIYIYGSSSERAWNVGTAGEFEDRFNPSTFDANIIWMDPSAQGRNNDKWGYEKSVFDPCPKGWKLPAKIASDGTWKDPGSWDVASHKSNAQFVNAWGENQVYGCYLWPQAKPAVVTEADLDRADFYPFEGYMVYSNGEMTSSIDALSSDNRQAPHWTSTPYLEGGKTAVHGMSLSLTRSGYGPIPSYQAQGYSVRCVKY